MNKYTLVLLYEDEESAVDWVTAENVQEAVTKCLDERPGEDVVVLAVFEGHHTDVWTTRIVDQGDARQHWTYVSDAE